MNDDRETQLDNDLNNEGQAQSKKELGIFEKYLPVWVAICMAVGILLSLFIPGIGEAIDSWKIGNISIPIGICLFLMMYPAMLNVQASELRKLGRNPKPIIVCRA